MKSGFTIICYMLPIYEVLICCLRWSSWIESDTWW